MRISQLSMLSRKNQLYEIMWKIFRQVCLFFFFFKKKDYAMQSHDDTEL